MPCTPEVVPDRRPVNPPSAIDSRHQTQSRPVQASPGQSNLSAGVATACRHNTPTPDLPSDHQPSSARPVADSINGEAGHGAEALIKNIPPPSCAPSQCALRDGSPAQSPEPKAQSLPSPALSPCLGICQFNDGGFCKSWFRNTIEKVRWLTTAEVEKAFVVATCAKRKANQHPSRRSDPETASTPASQP